MQEGLYHRQCFMITSATAHPCHYEVCNWLGIGIENCYEITKKVLYSLSEDYAQMFEDIFRFDNIVKQKP